MHGSSVEYHSRFCPRCATKNPVPGAVPFKCENCGFASFFGPVAAVAGLVVNEAGELLLVRRARDPGQGKWGLPGGFIDRNESAEAALVREILEETQLVVTQIQYLMTRPNQYNYHGVITPVIDLFYVCIVEATANLRLAADELDHYVWTQPTVGQLENMAFESNRAAIEHWMSPPASAKRLIDDSSQ